MSDIADLIARCHANPAPLSPWEAEFLAGMPSRATATPRQIEILEGIASRVSIDDVVANLRQHIEGLARELVGNDPTFTTSKALRFGSKGSMSVILSNPDRGEWFDHEAGAGGGPLELIEHMRQIKTSEAIEWAKHWLSADRAEYLAPRPAPSSVKASDETGVACGATICLRKCVNQDEKL